MLKRHLTNNQAVESLLWEDLTNGVPTIAAFAQLCSEVLADRNRPNSPADLSHFSAEAQAIVQSAANTGSISIRGDKNAFEPEERYLAICVELPEARRIEFRVTGNPQQTIRFMEGFRQLCCQGLVMHQLMNEFSLTATGFDFAKTIDDATVASLVSTAREV